MPPIKLVVTILALAAVSACNYSASGSSGSAGASSSSSSSASGKEITLSGTSGVAELAGDKIELKDGTAYVNGVSFGPVPAGSVVKYTLSAEGRSLFVGTERRSARQ
jgi:hypothetical protein